MLFAENLHNIPDSISLQSRMEQGAAAYIIHGPLPCTKGTQEDMYDMPCHCCHQSDSLSVTLQNCHTHSVSNSLSVLDRSKTAVTKTILFQDKLNKA